MTRRLGDACGAMLADLADSDARLWVLDGDLADSDGALAFAERHPSRFVMAGIAEQNMVSMAAGMASAGLRPWVFSFAAFLIFRAYDQIRVCLSQAQQPVVLVGSHSGGCTGRNGKTHAALNDLALMLSLPGFAVWSPGCEADLAFAMRAIVEADGPAYLRLPRRPLPELPGGPAEVRWLGDPRPIAILATGFATHLALAAQTELGRRGVQVGILHFNRLCGDPPPLTGIDLALVLEDHVTFGGLASRLAERCGGMRMVPFGWPREWAGQSGADDDLLGSQGLDARQLADAMVRAIG